jgi:nucleoid DNA-binding protein
MSTITKKELVNRIAQRTQVKHALVKATVQDFLDEIISVLAKGNRLEFRDFGVFESRTRAPRRAQNPKTLERIHVPAKRTVKFKMGRLMRQKLNSQNAKV